MNVCGCVCILIHILIPIITSKSHRPQALHTQPTKYDEVRKIIQSLNKKKSAISACIPVKLRYLSESEDIYLPFFADIINQSLKNGILPDGRKLIEVIPLFKKADPFDEINY